MLLRHSWGGALRFERPPRQADCPKERRPKAHWQTHTRQAARRPKADRRRRFHAIPGGVSRVRWKSLLFYAYPQYYRSPEMRLKGLSPSGGVRQTPEHSGPWNTNGPTAATSPDGQVLPGATPASAEATLFAAMAAVSVLPPGTCSKAATGRPPTPSKPPGPKLSRTFRGPRADPKDPHWASETPKTPAIARGSEQQFPAETATCSPWASKRGAEGI